MQKVVKFAPKKPRNLYDSAKTINLNYLHAGSGKVYGAKKCHSTAPRHHDRGYGLQPLPLGHIVLDEVEPAST